MLMDDMDDSHLFMHWAVSTLQHEEVPGGADETRAGFPCLQALGDSSELAEAHNRLSSGADTRRGGGLISPSPDAAMQQGSSSTLTSFPDSGSMSSTGTTNTQSMSWNFDAAQPSCVGGGTPAARAPLRSGVSQSTRRAAARKTAACAQEYIMAKSQLLPEIEAKLSGNKVMLRIHCEINGKGLIARVLAELEEFHLCIVHNNVMPFMESTMIITTMAKLEDGFTVNAEEIVGRLNQVLYQHSINKSCY